MVELLCKTFEGCWRDSDPVGSAEMSMYKHGDEMLFRLFDVVEMEHVCDLVRQTSDPVPNGYRTGLSERLRDLLLAPINCFIDRLYESGRGFNASEYPAADAFRTTVENLAQNLTLNEASSMDSRAASELTDALRSSWIEFIAQAGAYRMYDDLPRDLAKKRQRSVAGSEAVKKRKRLVRKLPADIVAQFERLVAKGCTDRDARSKLRQKYGVSRQGISKALVRTTNKKP